MTAKELAERQMWMLEQKIDHAIGTIESFIAHTEKTPLCTIPARNRRTVYNRHDGDREPVKETTIHFEGELQFVERKTFSKLPVKYLDGSRHLGVYTQIQHTYLQPVQPSRVQPHGMYVLRLWRTFGEILTLCVAIRLAPESLRSIHAVRKQRHNIPTGFEQNRRTVARRNKAIRII